MSNPTKILFSKNNSSLTDKCFGVLEKITVHTVYCGNNNKKCLHCFISISAFFSF